MKNETRKIFNKMTGDIGRTYGVDQVDRHFAATPSVEQKLNDKIVESSDVLQRINVVPVDEIKGEKILGSATGMLGKRTNTSTTDRATSNVLALDTQGYECVKTEFDVHMPYNTIDVWAKFPDFNNRYLGYVRQAIANARVRAGFYGTSAAAVTNAVTNPNGEDVNKGWIQKLRDYNAGAQVLVEGAVNDQIRIGGAGDFANLDALVFDVLQMIGAAHRESTDLVALMGRELLAYDKTQLYAAQGNKPTEKERIENGAVTRTYGGLPAYLVGFLPARGLIITSWKNLSLYYQSGSVRQKIEDNAKRDRIEHYTSINDAYVVEDEEKAAAIEFANVRLWNGTSFV